MSATQSAYPHNNTGSTDHRVRRRSNSAMHLAHGSPQQQAAVDDVRREFHVSNEQLHSIVHGFEKEMEAGLADVEGGMGDLKMIPSYVIGYPTGNEQGTYLALEISGVDIYVCQVVLKGEGGKLAINQYQYEIPDDLTAGNDIGILIDYVADCVSDFQRRVSESSSHHHHHHHRQEQEQQQTVYSMAISLGFAVRQTGLDRGTIMALEHGFEFPNVIGRDVVDLFHSRFQAKGLNVRIVAIANDSVCTLLAHAYQHPATRIGIVHNIGTNCAYYDKVCNISKFLAQIKHQQHPQDNNSNKSSSSSSSSNSMEPYYNNDMIMNTEWCNFGSRHLPMCRYDKLVDNQSNNRGIHIFEKMTTGMYLGEIVRQVLVDLVNRQILSFQINDDEECLLRTPYQFDTSYMYVCEADDDWENLEDTRVVLEEMCKVAETTQADREIVKKVCELVGQRAAMLLGANIASVVKHMVERGIGLDRNSDGFAIAISGEVYKDYPSFHPRVCETLKALIPEDVSTKISVGIVKFSRIVGAAIVAMMAEKMDQQDVEML
ncbi:hexokinase-domain-containing protein [Zychaea mexicana]|uniref:hexokinase-domain-containing protein n=1 Tax=Zychaea mexicana TaxID=64656 RepID=UPI0022FEC064|nr:hexokinase-domain-containing protein [Zychaea mexicana]KAI9488001.1 hexokinase-domain-containing protein [Zychaea mexicana]